MIEHQQQADLEISVVKEQQPTATSSLEKVDGRDECNQTNFAMLPLMMDFDTATATTGGENQHHLMLVDPIGQQLTATKLDAAKYGVIVASSAAQQPQQQQLLHHHHPFSTIMQQMPVGGSLFNQFDATSQFQQQLRWVGDFYLNTEGKGFYPADLNSSLNYTSNQSNFRDITTSINRVVGMPRDRIILEEEPRRTGKGQLLRALLNNQQQQQQSIFDHQEQFTNNGLPPQQQYSNDGVFGGPKGLPNSMHRILTKLNGKLNSQHYDTFYLAERVQKLHQPAQNKLDKFFEAKMKYGSTLSRDCGRGTQAINHHSKKNSTQHKLITSSLQSPRSPSGTNEYVHQDMIVASAMKPPMSMLQQTATNLQYDSMMMQGGRHTSNYHLNQNCMYQTVDINAEQPSNQGMIHRYFPQTMPVSPRSNDSWMIGCVSPQAAEVMTADKHDENDETALLRRQIQDKLKKSIRDQDLSCLSGFKANRLAKDNGAAASRRQQESIDQQAQLLEGAVPADALFGSDLRKKQRAMTQRQKFRLQLKLPNDQVDIQLPRQSIKSPANTTLAPNSPFNQENAISKNSFTTQQRDLPSRSDLQMTPSANTYTGIRSPINPSRDQQDTRYVHRKLQYDQKQLIGREKTHTQPEYRSSMVVAGAGKDFSMQVTWEDKLNASGGTGNKLFSKTITQPQNNNKLGVPTSKQTTGGSRNVSKRLKGNSDISALLDLKEEHQRINTAGPIDPQTPIFNSFKSCAMEINNDACLESAMFQSQASHVDPRTLKPKLSPARKLTQQGVNTGINSNQTIVRKDLKVEQTCYSEIEEKVTSQNDTNNNANEEKSMHFWGSINNPAIENNQVDRIGSRVGENATTPQPQTPLENTTQLRDQSLLIPSAEETNTLEGQMLKQPPGIFVDTVQPFSKVLQATNRSNNGKATNDKNKQATATQSSKKAISLKKQHFTAAPRSPMMQQFGVFNDQQLIQEKITTGFFDNQHHQDLQTLQQYSNRMTTKISGNSPRRQIFSIGETTRTTGLANDFASAKTCTIQQPISSSQNSSIIGSGPSSTQRQQGLPIGLKKAELKQKQQWHQHRYATTSNSAGPRSKLLQQKRQIMQNRNSNNFGTIELKNQKTSFEWRQPLGPIKFFSIQVQNEMHNSKQPFQFLRTSRAPQNKTAKIDFFFKKDPRLAEHNKQSIKQQQITHDKGESVHQQPPLYQSYYQRQFNNNALLAQESSNISETYQQILNLKKTIETAEQNSTIFISPTQLLEESINLSNPVCADTLQLSQTTKSGGQYNGGTTPTSAFLNNNTLNQMPPASFATVNTMLVDQEATQQDCSAQHLNKQQISIMQQQHTEQQQQENTDATPVNKSILKPYEQQLSLSEPEEGVSEISPIRNAVKKPNDSQKLETLGWQTDSHRSELLQQDEVDLQLAASSQGGSSLNMNRAINLQQVVVALNPPDREIKTPVPLIVPMKMP